MWLRLRAIAGLRLPNAYDPVDESDSKDTFVLHSNKSNLTISAAYL